MAARSPTPDERALVSAILSEDFDGVEALRGQWAHSLVAPSCGCGCGSLGFVFEPGFAPTPSTARNPVPFEAEVIDSNGAVVGGVIILLRDGVLDDVDVHAFGLHPLPFPVWSSVRVVATGNVD